MTASNPTGRAAPQPMISYTVRLAVKDFELLKFVADSTGRTKQDLVGDAIRQTYGQVDQEGAP